MNKSTAEWVLEPRNIELGIFVYAIKGQQVPASNRLCPVCNDRALVKRLNQLSEKQLFAAVHEGKLHGWNKEKICIYNNVVYHHSCLVEKFGDKYPELVKNGDILEE